MEMSVVYLSVNPDNKTIKSMRKNMLTGKELRQMFIDNDIDGLRQCVPKEFIGPLLREWDKAQEQKQRILEEKRIEPFSGRINTAISEIVKKISSKRRSTESFCNNDIDNLVREIVGDLDHCEQISKEDIAAITRKIVDELDNDEFTQEDIDEIASKVAASIARLSNRGQQSSPAPSGFVPSPAPAPAQERPATTITGNSDDVFRKHLQEQQQNALVQPTDGAPDLDPPPGKTFAQQIADEMLPDRLAGERFKQSLDQQVADLVAQEKYEPPQPAANASRISGSATNQSVPAKQQDGESLVDKVKEEQRQSLQPETQPVSPEAGFSPAPQGQPTPDVAGNMRGSVAAMDPSAGIGAIAEEGAQVATIATQPQDDGVMAPPGGVVPVANSCFLKISNDKYGGRSSRPGLVRKQSGTSTFSRGIRNVRH